MIPFRNSFENDMHLSKHTHYWNISSRYIPLLSFHFFSSLSHSLCTGLPFLLDEVRWTACFWSLSVLLSGFASGGLGVVTPGPSSAWPGSQSCQQSAVVIKTQMWTLCPSSLAMLFAFQPIRNLQHKERLSTSSAVCRKALDVWPSMSVDCPRLRRVCSPSPFSGGSPTISIGKVGTNSSF